MSDTLTVHLDIASELVREGDDALIAAIVFRKWGGQPSQIEAASAPITSTSLALSVTVPDSITHTSLPEELGGPFEFAIGYILVHGKGDGEDVKVVSPSYRVLWLARPFPTESFGKALAKLPDMSAGEQKHTLSELAGLPTGLSLAFAVGATRSLIGFSTTAPEETVRLEPSRTMAWPPEVF